MSDYEKMKGLYSELNQLLAPDKAPDHLSANDATNMFYLTLEYNALVDEFNSSPKTDREVSKALEGMLKIKSSAKMILG